MGKREQAAMAAAARILASLRCEVLPLRRPPEWARRPSDVLLMAETWLGKGTRSRRVPAARMPGFPRHRIPAAGSGPTTSGSGGVAKTAAPGNAMAADDADSPVCHLDVNFRPTDADAGSGASSNAAQPPAKRKAAGAAGSGGASSGDEVCSSPSKRARPASASVGGAAQSAPDAVNPLDPEIQKELLPVNDDSAAQDPEIDEELPVNDDNAAQEPRVNRDDAVQEPESDFFSTDNAATAQEPETHEPHVNCGDLREDEPLENNRDKNGCLRYDLNIALREDGEMEIC